MKQAMSKNNSIKKKQEKNLQLIINH